jgi:hypothetical protein
LTDVQLRAVAVPISGTVTANVGTGTQPVSGTVTANAGTGTFAVSGPLTDAQIRATPLPVSGTVTANAGSGTMAVSGTFWQATQPVSAAALPLPPGAATDAVLTARFGALSAAVDGYATLTDGTETVLVAAGAGGTRNYITAISGTNTSATPVRVDIKTGTTVKHSFYLAASGGGFSHVFPFPWRCGDAESVRVQLSASVTDVRISATGFRI